MFKAQQLLQSPSALALK